MFQKMFSLRYQYQRVAVSWMFELFKNRLGGILGDEMGLGKTVQVRNRQKASELESGFIDMIV